MTALVTNALGDVGGSPSGLVAGARLEVQIDLVPASAPNYGRRDGKVGATPGRSRYSGRISQWLREICGRTAVQRPQPKLARCDRAAGLRISHGPPLTLAACLEPARRDGWGRHSERRSRCRQRGSDCSAHGSSPWQMAGACRPRAQSMTGSVTDDRKRRRGRRNILLLADLRRALFSAGGARSRLAVAASYTMPRRTNRLYNPRQIACLPREEVSHGTSDSTTLPRISRPRRPKARSVSTTGSATNGSCCSRIPRTSRRSARPSSATWRRSSPSSTSAASRSSACRSTRSTSMSSWANDIKETQGFAPNYPMIGDTDFNVSKLYGMLPASVSGDPAKRTRRRQPDRAQRLRHRPGQEDQADPGLSDDHRAAISTRCCA